MNKFSLLILISILPEISFASHAMGGEISYKSLGNNTYEITYTFYRDCSGIAGSTTASLMVVPLAGSSTSYNLPLIPNSPVRLHTTCPSALTTCNGGFNLGVEKWTYSGVITLPSEIVTIYHAENARSGSLTTITGAGSDDLFVYAVIDNSSATSDNSPVFNLDPTLILCQNTPFCIPSFVTDSDGDSLSFSLITPRNGPNLYDTVTYLSGYSATQPFSSSPAITFDSHTGEICITPTTASEVSPVAILVSEFRNGVLIGQVERDMQTTVQTCNNNTPQLTGIDGTPVYNLNVCAGQQNCFYITATDADSSNQVFVNWDISIPNAGTIHSLGPRDTLFICWTPADSDTMTNPHCFYSLALDDNCPYPATSYKTYCLNVIPSQICNPTGVEEVSFKQTDFTVYPQPASDQLNFEFQKANNRQWLVVCSMFGNVIEKFRLTDKSIRMNSASLTSGIYIARIIDENGLINASKPVMIIK